MVSMRKGDIAPFDGRLIEKSKFMIIWSRLNGLEASALELDNELKICRAEHGQFQALLQLEKMQNERDLAKRMAAELLLEDVTAERDKRFTLGTTLIVSGVAMAAGAVIMLFVVSAD